jgi:hypothetical protein
MVKKQHYHEFALFCRGVKKQFGNHIARILLFCLVFGSGMHVSAAGMIFKKANI